METAVARSPAPPLRASRREAHRDAHALVLADRISTRELMMTTLLGHALPLLPTKGEPPDGSAPGCGQDGKQMRGARSRDGRWSIDPGFPMKVGGRHMSEPTSPARDSSLEDR